MVCFRNIVPQEAFKWIWKSKCSPKIKFFCWLLFSDRLNTRNMLRRRHFNVTSNFNCPLCSQQQEETVDHLFFHCPFSIMCWNELQMHWDQNGNRLDIVTNARKNHNRPMFMETFMLGAWSIWKERNNWVFNQILPDKDSWKARFSADFSLLVYRTKEKLHPLIVNLVQNL